MEKTKKKRSLSAYSILILIILFVAILSWIFNGAQFAPVVPKGAEEAVTEVAGARLPDITMSFYNGFVDAIDIAIFVMVIGGFLAVVNKTGALEAGIHRLVKNMKGREMALIAVLMILFSIGGSTYGMAEETVALYPLIITAMVAAGFDTMVAVATVLLGAGAGVLGSTVNPFATGVAMDALNGAGVECNKGTVILLGAILWAVALGTAMYFVLKYASKVHKDKGSTILSLQEREVMDKEFKTTKTEDELVYTGRHKVILLIFAITFIVMIISLIPWPDFGVTAFEGWSAFLTDTALGEWYFPEISVLFFLMSIVIGWIGRLSEKELVNAFIDGAKDILSVVLVIVVARAASVLMAQTHIDALILDRSATALAGLPVYLFVPFAYIVYIALSFFIPSTSGLATLSIPVMGGLAARLGYSPEVMILIFCAAEGVVNYVTPTSGVVMGAIQISKMELGTWYKWVKKPLIFTVIFSIIVLTVAMMIF